MHKRFGTGGVFRCKDCDHLIKGRYHDRNYSKCELYGMTHSVATDWRQANQACGMYGIEQDMSHWTPIIEQLRYSPRLEQPIDGQIGMGV